MSQNPDSLIFLKFKNNFCRQYYRNNKPKKSFRLECFPECCARGHVANSFCGQPVVVEVSCIGDWTVSINELKFYAEFNKLSDSDNLLPDSFKAVQNVPNLYAPIKHEVYEGYVGQILLPKYCNESNETTFVVKFNIKRASWDYSWTSNRFYSLTEHVMSVHMFKSNENDMLHLRSTASPSFIILSNRRSASKDGRGSSSLHKRSYCKISSANRLESKRIAITSLHEISSDTPRTSDEDSSKGVETVVNSSDEESSKLEQDLIEFLIEKHNPFIVKQSCFLYDVRRRFQMAGILEESLGLSKD